MARFDYIYTNFSAGEFSPLLEGRIELDKYNSGAKKMRNYRPRPHGPAEARGGTRYIAKAKLDGSYNVRLIEFVPGIEGQYILEFGDLYIRFFTQHGQLVGDGTGHPLDVPYEIVSPYGHLELDLLEVAQDANELYIAHPDHDTHVLTRVDTYNWTLLPVTFTAKPPEWVAGNYPSALGFYQQRLYLGGTRDQPQTFWASQAPDGTTGNPKYGDFTLGANDADAFKYTIASDKASKIFWFNPSDSLLIGTEGGIFKITSTNFEEAVTPTNVRVVLQTDYGVSKVAPARIADELLYMQKGGKKLRNSAYSLEKDRRISKDVTILSEHITKTKIVDSAYQNEPDSIMWLIRSDGQIVGVSYEPDLEVTGWFRYVISGGIVKSIGVIDGWFDIAHDELWMAVRRTISSNDVMYIEVLEPALKPEEDQIDSFYVDSGLSTDPSSLPLTVVTGLDHLEGENVSILVDGWVHPDQTVVGGSVTLEQEATQAVHIGMRERAELRTLRPEGGNPIGTSQGKVKRISNIGIRLYRSLGLKIGDEDLEEYYFGPPEQMNVAIPLFSGDIFLEPDVDYSRDAEISIVQDYPLPSTIICVMAEIRTE